MKYTWLLLCSLMMVTLACHKNCDDDDQGQEIECGNNWNPTEAFDDYAAAVNAASEVYVNAPTMANCEAYRESFEDYLEQVKRHRKCYEEQGQEERYERAVETLESSIASLDC